MWSAPAKNMKKINMSISFVYSVSIRGNCENAVFTFLLFYKQNIAFFYFYQEHLQIPAYKQDAGISYCKDCCRQNSAG